MFNLNTSLKKNWNKAVNILNVTELPCLEIFFFLNILQTICMMKWTDPCNLANVYKQQH